MVVRKSSLPFTSSPSSHTPTYESQMNHHESSNGEQPASYPSPHKPLTDSPYEIVGNPWHDESPSRSHPQWSNGSTAPNMIDQQLESSHSPAHKIPDVLKPGWSGQVTPRSSFESDRSKDFWESSDEEEGGNKKDKRLRKPDVAGTDSAAPDGNVPKTQLPDSLQIKRKPIGTSPVLQQAPLIPPLDFASNNPFRQQTNSELDEQRQLWGQASLGKGKGKEVGDSHSPPHLPFAALQIGHNDGTPFHQSSAPLSEEGLSLHQGLSYSVPQPSAPPPPVPVQAPPAVPEPTSPFSRQPPLIPVLGDANQASAISLSRVASPLPEQKAEYTDGLLDRGDESAPVSLADELKALPNHAPPTLLSNAPSVQSSHLPSSEVKHADKAPARGNDKVPFSTGSETKESYQHARDDGSQPAVLLLDEQQPLLSTSQVSRAPPNGDLWSPFSGASSSLRHEPDKSEMPPLKPPRPAVVTKPLTAAELAQMQEQRNETYQIKHFRWFDHRLNKLRSSSMLTQNKNGPCPLLALVNALILGAEAQDQAILDEFLSTREQVTLGTIIENLMMELLSSGADGQLPDVDELNRFLLKLRSGMNMNPRLAQPPAPAPNLMDARHSMLDITTLVQPQNKPGTFEPTQDIRLYSSFTVETVHGWLPEPDSAAAASFARSAQSYEDAQAKLFGEEELEYKLSTTGLTPEEQVVWEDITTMKNFLQVHPTQLTPYGLHCIQSSMHPGQFKILFRNDHFSTIYKHPQDGQLYTLITDAGFADRDEIIWESLVDVSGQYSEFFSGDFKSVSHSSQQRPHSASQRRQSTPVSGIQNSEHDTPLSPVQRQEQEDADLAMAMQLQEEEEQRHRQRTASQAAPQAAPTSNAQNPSRGRRSTGNIPITLSSNRANSSQEVRPLIPPRSSRTQVQAVNRPSDVNQADAPPAYEEAAKGKPYNPPLGSPLHPHSSTTLDGSRTDLSTGDHSQASGSASRPSAGNQRRRNSAYNENAGRQNSRYYGQPVPSPAYDFTDSRMPGSYIHTGHGGHGQSAHLGGYSAGNTQVQGGQGPGRQRDRDRDRDCVVM